MLRLIVVDDEKDARDKMIKCIDKETNGIEIVAAAADGIQACELISTHLPDIVLIDVEMPGMSGLDVIRQARDNGLTTVFIIISSYNNFHYARDAIRLKVDDYLLKPFLPADVCGAVYRAAERIRPVRLLPYFANLLPSTPSPQQIPMPGDTLSGKSAPLSYPYNQERMLIESLQVGTQTEVQASLQSFFDAVRSQNDNSDLILNCYIILYVEIYRAAMSFGLDFSSLDACVTLMTDFRPELFEQTLSSLCSGISERVNTNAQVNSVISQAIRFIAEHYREPLSLDYVASHVHISSCYLSGLFMKTLSVRFTEYVNKIRIENAIRLMSESPYLKNYEIGQQVGYVSDKYFSQVFKKIMNVTVSQYRSNLFGAMGQSALKGSSRPKKPA